MSKSENVDSLEEDFNSPTTTTVEESHDFLAEFLDSITPSKRKQALAKAGGAGLVAIGLALLAGGGISTNLELASMSHLTLTYLKNIWSQFLKPAISAF